MPQVFQVLRCYKCSIFQVHQTKKDNKWKCKVCGEKQSVKRHYGIGTAKDCRIHVQKLNNMQVDKKESKLKPTDSDSEQDCEENTENDHNDQINNTQVLTDNAKSKSKWSAYVEKEEITAVKEPEYIDDIAVCLELPRKRKINRKRKAFKVPKISTNDYDEKSEIYQENSNNLANFNNDNLNDFNDNSTYLYYESVRNQLVTIKNKNDNFRTNKASKWAQYENNELDDHYEVLENNENYTEENKKYYDGLTDDKNDKHYCHKKKDTVITDDDGIQNRHHCNKKENDHSPITIEPIFSLCDDNNLDEVLDF